MGKQAGAKRNLAGSAAAADKKRQRNLTSEQKAQQALRDNCKGLSDEEKFFNKNRAGQTMLEHVTECLEKKATCPSYSMGMHRWRDIKAMFRGATDPITLLKPPSPEEAVPPALIKACIAAKRAHADRTLLQNFLGSFKHPNKTSLCGIYRLALGLNPARSSHLLVCMDIARWTQREQLKDKFEREVEIMFDFFDKVFMANFLAGKLKALDFAKLHAKVLELVLDGDTLGKVLATEEDNYDTIVESINELVGSSGIGVQLFSWHALRTLSKAVDDLIRSKVEALLVDAIYEEKVNSARSALLAAVNAMPNVGLLASKRIVPVRWGKHNINNSLSMLSGFLHSFYNLFCVTHINRNVVRKLLVGCCVGCEAIPG